MINIISIIASLVFFITGLAFFNKRKEISAPEFISQNYLLTKIHFSPKVMKKLLLRRLSMSDIVEIDGVPNWITALLIEKNPEKLKEKAKQSNKKLGKKTDAEMVKETKDYFNFLQKVAERTIVKWDIYVKEWQKVDPEYTGRLPDITLQEIFDKQINPTKNIVKKKSSYNALRWLQMQATNPHRTTLQKKN